MMVEERNRAQDVAALQDNPILGSLPDDTLVQLMPHMTHVELSAGKTFITQGKKPSSVSIVQSGILRYVCYSTQGHDAGLGLFKADDWLGLGGLYGLPVTGTVEALTRCALLEMPLEQLIALLADHPHIAKILHQHARQQLADLEERLCEMMTLPVPERLARTLIRLGQRFGVHSEKGLYINAPLTRLQLADLVGTRFETVSRTLSAWERDGAVISQRQKIWIVSHKKLAQLAQMDD